MVWQGKNQLVGSNRGWFITVHFQIYTYTFWGSGCTSIRFMNNQIEIYQGIDGKTPMDGPFEGDTFWLPLPANIGFILISLLSLGISKMLIEKVSSKENRCWIRCSGPVSKIKFCYWLEPVWYLPQLLHTSFSFYTTYDFVIPFNQVAIRTA